MTTIDPPQLAGDAAELVPVLPDTAWDRFEALLARASDRLNPILVKEARQALRSRQFVITFFLMLIAGWVWSILGLATIGPAVYYSAEGPQMLFVYHMILSFPLLVVAPYSAYHSLASERQDRTYELVSITALDARQILSGKLGGIMLQMMVYLSAIFPCLAFTYLLRGLDIFTIVLVVTYTCALSLALSVTGLLLAAVTPLRQRQIAMSALFAMALFGAMIADNSWTSGIVHFGGMMISSQGFWIVQSALATLFFNYFAIVFLAARSQIMTASENRSTALRCALVVAQLSYLAWMAWAQMVWGGDFIFGFIYFSTVGWFVFGMFLVGESPRLSPRVKRDLPQSTLGRVLGTWFTPGPGTGYMFVIANMLAMGLLACLPYAYIGAFFHGVQVVNVGAIVRAPNNTSPHVFEAAVIGTSYVVIYLGLSCLIIRAARRFTDVKLAAPVLVNVCLVAAGSAIPWVIQMTSPQLRNAGYTLLQISNPIWTLGAVCFGRTPFDLLALVLMLPTAALGVWILNLPPLLDDLKQTRIAAPPRVAEEDAEKAAALAGPAGPKDPWDEGAGAAG